MTLIRRVVVYIRGFTLIELIISIGILAVIAVVALVALNPGLRLSGGRDSARWTDINAIHEAEEFYRVDHGIFLPTVDILVANTNYMIGTAGNATQQHIAGDTCDVYIGAGNGVDISGLVPNYLTAVPVAPGMTSNTVWSAAETGYYLRKSATGASIIIGACDAEVVTRISTAIITDTQPPPSACPTTRCFYVDQQSPNCTDTGTGTLESQPWCTLHRATDGVPSREQGGIAGTFAPVMAGDTVYVKNGTYTDTTPAVESDISIKFQPTNSGTASAPLAFRAYTPATGPRHRPLVARNLVPPAPGVSTVNSPVIGTAGGQNYIIWDGFATAPRTDIGIRNCTGCIVENMLIDKGAFPDPGALGNYTGIFMEGTADVIIRNNTIRNVFFLNRTDPNAACIKMYDNTRVHIHNNLLQNCNTGIHDKRNGVNDLYEFNYIKDMTTGALGFATFVEPSCGACMVEGNVFRYNVVNNAGFRTVHVPGASNIRNIQIYNNTFYGGAGNRLGMRMENTTPPGLALYNNIIMRDPSATGGVYGHEAYGPSGPSADLLSNYNLFWGLTSANAVFSPVEGSGITETLTQWQVRGFDGNSSVSDPQFVGPISSTASVDAFRLQSSSPAQGAGRVGGIATGAAVNIGAYATGSEIIGVSSP